MKLSEELWGLIQKRSLLQHPFYLAWNKGELSLDTLRFYATQYYRQVEAFPRFVSSVHSRCPEISARKLLLENLVDEELHGTDHPQLWMQFAEGLGVTAEALQTALPSAETKSCIDTFFKLTSGDWKEGLCALYAYEAQVPEVAKSKIEGLRKFYGIQDDRALAFFTAHIQYDVEHSRAVSELVNRHAKPDEAQAAAQTAADALWGFLDGVCRETGLSC